MPPWGSVGAVPRIAAAAVLERPPVPNRDQQTAARHLSENVNSDVVGPVHLAEAIAVDPGTPIST